MIDDPKPNKGIYDLIDKVKETSILRNYEKEKMYVLLIDMKEKQK